MSWLRLVSCVLLTLLLSCSVVSESEPTRRDGNWWFGRGEEFKTAYVLGMLDGVTLGWDFALWGIKDDITTKKVLDAFSETERRRTSHVTVGQVTDGLDDFYRDYKNRRIELVYAVQVVLEGTAGMPKDQLEKWVENLRQIASKY